MNWHLLNVQVAVGDVSDQVSGWDLGVICRDPGPVAPLAAGRSVQRDRLLSGDLRHADRTEPASRGPLDVLQNRQVALSPRPGIH
jgi:hypothetical protein